MSIPGAQPNPYQQPNPYMQNPPTPPAAPGGYGYPPPMPPGGSPPGRQGGGGKGWLWALGGALTASVVWLVSVLATGALEGSDDPEPDLAGYHFHKDMCEAAPLDSFLEHYEERNTSSPDYRYASQEEGLDVSYCSQSLTDPKADTSSYTSTMVAVSVEWHKGTDPAGEFESRWRGYTQRHQDNRTHRVEAVTGFGDEAYRVTETGKDDVLQGVTLAIRDGWLTYDMVWSQFGSDDSSPALSEERISEMLESDTKAALEKLRQQPDGDSGGESGDSEGDSGDTEGDGGDSGDRDLDGDDATPPGRDPGDEGQEDV